jgi:hypothetical protein
LAFGLDLSTKISNSLAIWTILCEKKVVDGCFQISCRHCSSGIISDARKDLNFGKFTGLLVVCLILMSSYPCLPSKILLQFRTKEGVQRYCRLCLWTCFHHDAHETFHNLFLQFFFPSISDILVSNVMSLILISDDPLVLQHADHVICCLHKGSILLALQYWLIDISRDKIQGRPSSSTG